MSGFKIEPWQLQLHAGGQGADERWLACGAASLQQTGGCFIMALTPTHLFKQTGTVQRKSEASTTGRAPIETWTDQITGFRFSLQPMKSAKVVLYGAERAQRMYTLFCDPSVDIRSGDRVVYSDDRTGTTTTRYLRVASAPVNLIESDVVLELDVESVEATP